MIYEVAFVLKQDASEDASKKVQDSVKEAITAEGGEVLLEDDWGVRSFAQPSSRGEKRGHYFYKIYKGPAKLNSELERRFRISESVVKFVTVKLGEEADQESVLKTYKTPNFGVKSEAGIDEEKEKRAFLKRKSCYFSAKKTQPDWKDAGTYAWLVNEFGKISPARVTGLRPKYQRMATTAIKRARCMGLISYMSSRTAR